ncbi:PREDICTED: E3 ubiquitin protein ligase DRIP2 [Theobroma cacao]|uniref:E3 ubiquitin protein ligase DRIP2 n=1 Tax=Theobroma cacao TaxID=3641 RepID=A0AB32WA68_THECC|nr:PREDICTED: E3 ubiquitin protein ligase DRIP2 [Theobroma cacao]
MMMERGEGVSKVAREKLVACMTCPLCNKLFKDATSISECLHTFCRKCIYEKITEEELDSCPVCNIDLGCAPLEKLRADNNWQDIRIKIFPPKRQKSKESENMALVPLPARRKERSLSSLVVSTPRVSAKPCLTGRRSKLTARKTIASREPSLLNEEHVSKLEGLPQNLSSPETYSKIAQNSRQNFTVGESSKQHAPDRSTAEALEEKADLWKPLNHLVEAASKTKPNKVNSQGSIAKPAPHAPDNEVNLLTVKECGTGSNIPSKQNDSAPEPSTSARPRRSRGTQQKREAVSERLNIPAQAVVDSSNKYDGRFSPIWFSLVASKSQEGDAPLPQISSCYLRVKDGNLPVSSIKKYLVRKLGLSSETEVEISLRGRPVLSTLQLHNLVDWWVQTTPASERIQTFVGSSAKDFVMVLSYSRKAQPP